MAKKFDERLDMVLDAIPKDLKQYEFLGNMYT